MFDLMGWLKRSDQHPQITSSVFHYEFDFIHPFSDGNGQVGRFWQTLVLNHWSALLAQLPVESMVHEHQSDYYQAINASTKQTNSAPFIEFMLTAILETIVASTGVVTPQVSQQVKTLLKALYEASEPLSRGKLQSRLALKDRESFRERYIESGLEAGLIEMTIPDKPNSRLQQYRLTEQDQALAATLI